MPRKPVQAYRGSELIAVLTTPQAALGGTDLQLIHSFVLNPVNLSASKMRQFAAMFRMFKFGRLRLRFESQQATSAAGALLVVYVPSSKTPPVSNNISNVQLLSTLNSFVQGSVYRDLLMPVQLEQEYPWFLTAHSNLEQSKSAQGRIDVYMTAGPGTASTLGYLYADYVLGCRDEYLPSGLPDAANVVSYSSTVKPSLYGGSVAGSPANAGGGVALLLDVSTATGLNWTPAIGDVYRVTITDTATPVSSFAAGGKTAGPRNTVIYFRIQTLTSNGYNALVGEANYGYAREEDAALVATSSLTGALVNYAPRNAVTVNSTFAATLNWAGIIQRIIIDALTDGLA